MATSSKPVEIVCPPDRHIPIPFVEIFDGVKVKMNVEQKERFLQVCQLIECLYQQEYMVLRRNIKQNFLPFSVGAKEQPLPSKAGKGLPTTDNLDDRELRLVRDFIQLMAAARFHVLTHDEWVVAKQENFKFYLPVEVNWDYFDSRMLSRVWDSDDEHTKLRYQLPEMADRVAVFHRGIGVAEARDLFINEKIDLLVEYLVVTPVLKLWSYITRKPVVDELADINLSSSTHKNRKVVERRTLHRLMPTVWSVIKSFPKKLDLQEPSFKEVVVLYRSAVKPASSKTPVTQQPMDVRLKNILKTRNIHIKCFHDIPMADLEVIFPDKKVYIKPLSLIQLAITIVGAFVAAIMMILNSKDAVNWSLIWSALSLVIARCGQVYSSMQSERSKTIQDMVNILYDKTNDAQEGVVSMLLEDMADQQLKEAVLAYTLLHNADAELDEEQLDELCEAFLDKEYNLKIDFAVEDALPRLLKWGLIKAVPSGRYVAVPVEQAAKLLEVLWSKAFEALSRPPDSYSIALAQLVANISGASLPDIPRGASSRRHNLPDKKAAKAATVKPVGKGPATESKLSERTSLAAGNSNLTPQPHDQQPPTLSSAPTMARSGSTIKTSVFASSTVGVDAPGTPERHSQSSTPLPPLAPQAPTPPRNMTSGAEPHLQPALAQGPSSKRMSKAATFAHGSGGAEDAGPAPTLAKSKSKSWFSSWTLRRKSSKSIKVE